MNQHKTYEIIILGGGLAGLTLALQLCLSKKDISILILEKRSSNAPVATHKVGESIVELGSFYMREVLQLKEYLEEHQLPKYGFRFFFSPEQSGDISRRVEVGSKILRPIPAHQIDRGLFENELLHRLSLLKVDMELGATVQKVELSQNVHKIHYEKAGQIHTKESRWIIDASGRRGFLRRSLNLAKTMDHHINAVWFRLEEDIDIDDWSENEHWRRFLDEGNRRLATNHLMGEGYWIWIIPLVSGHTSIGIVADPAFHSFEDIHTFDKALLWLEKHEPQAGRIVQDKQDRLRDFKVMKQFAHDCQQFYSADRWGLTGDAAAFMDPFYSPGTDFIALGNSWLTELIVRDLAGEDIRLRTMIYELAHRKLLDGWLLLYQQMYGIFGNTQIMLLKIVWDWATYWAIPCLMFMNQGFTTIDVMKRYSATSNSIGQRFARLNLQMQQLFRDWASIDHTSYADQYVDVFELECVNQFHEGLAQQHNPDELIRQVEANVHTLEQMAAEIFRLVCAKVHGTPPDLKVNPYQMTLKNGIEHILSLAQHASALALVESIQQDMAKAWLPFSQHQTANYV
ncbi:MAG: FAD-dependent monooxygenase [Bacteroidota bacterium]